MATKNPETPRESEWNDFMYEEAALKAEINNLNEEEQTKKEPDRIKVKNRVCAVCGKVGVYEGSWLSGGKNRCDNPGGGKGIFISNDGNYVLDGLWNIDGNFIRGKIDTKERTLQRGYHRLNEETRKARSFNIKHVNVDSNDKTKLFSMIGTYSIDGHKCDCVLDKNLQLKSITYEGITLYLVHDEENGQTYLKNKSGKICRIHVSDHEIIEILKGISKAKNSGKTVHKFDSNIRLYIRYEDRDSLDMDVIIGNDRDRKKIVNWLNESRKDFGI